MMDRVWKLSCDSCEAVVESQTNRFPPGWKWSQLLGTPVTHACPDCLSAGKASKACRWQDPRESFGMWKKSGYPDPNVEYHLAAEEQP